MLTELEEAGEEDICSLLNQVIAVHMGVQPYPGSRLVVDEYLAGLQQLVRMGEVAIREYRITNGARGPDSASFTFDPGERIWTWQGTTRLMVRATEETLRDEEPA